MLKFRTLLKAKDLLYVVDREHDEPCVGDSDLMRAVKVTQAAGRLLNDAKQGAGPIYKQAQR